jgi:REP element-mobilizing transposase RayT
MITVGIHLVWTSYGTWLPGDDRGHWSPLYDMYGKVVDGGGKLQMPDPTTRAFSRRRMNEPPMILTPADVQAVADELGDLLSKPDSPTVYAATIEPTHVHLLVGPVREDLRTFAGRLKGRSSSEVLTSDRHPQRQRVWTERYWRVFLGDDLGLDAVREYIERHHERAGRARNPYAWCRPELIGR